MKKMLVAIVKWKDHTSQDAWINDGEEFDEHTQLHTVTSIGWLREETDEKVVLVSAVDHDRGGCSCIQTIGKAMIVEIRVGGKYRGGESGQRKRRAKERPSEAPKTDIPAQ